MTDARARAEKLAAEKYPDRPDGLNFSSGARKSRKDFINGYLARDAETEEELERLQGVERRLAELLCDLAGGKLSKTNYPVPTMVQQVEQHLQECSDAELPALNRAVRAVLELHKPGKVGPYGSDGHCTACLDGTGGHLEWPCQTVRAIYDAMGEE